MTKSMFCYISIAILTTYLAQLEHLNSDELPGWTWIGWSRFAGYIVLAGLTTFKAYVARPPDINPVEEKKETESNTYDKHIEDHK